MKKIICDLLIVGSILLGGACSDDNAPISGVLEDLNSPAKDASNVPVANMSYEDCNCADLNHPDDTLHGCFYSNEMWSRTSGYRVRTGFDNGTNTSGIWNWSVSAANGRNVRVNWSKPSSESYDSTSLAQVIDYCHGSLCGMAVFDKAEDSSRSSVSIKFSFAGKNASGKFKTIDARAMQGICIEYIADAMRVELDLDDSLNTLMNGDFYGVDLPPFPVKHFQGDAEGNRICYPWSQFQLSNATGENPPQVSIDNAVSHLQGLRFTISTNQRYAVINQFDIIGLGRYASPAVKLIPVLPANETCQVLSVTDYFCGCSYPKERSDEVGRLMVFQYFISLGTKAVNESVWLTKNAETCIANHSFELQKYAVPSNKNWDCACADLHPKTIACDDGSKSESQDFAEMMSIFNANANAFFEQQKPMADSLFEVCLNMRDTLFNGELVPDSCRREEILMNKNIMSLPYANSAFMDADAEFEKRIDSLYRTNSLDEATQYCIQQRFPNVAHNEKPRMAPMLFNPIVKSLRCKSGNVYYTDEYKQFLQEFGIKDDTDSLDVYDAAKKYSLQLMENQFNTCVDGYGNNGIIWDAVWTKVNTGFDNGSETSGKWFYVTDSADGGKSHIEWNNGYVVKDWNDPNALDTLLRNDRQLKGSAYFVKTSIRAPFVNLGFWLAGEDGKGDHDAVDITDKEGICLDFDLSNTGYTSTGFTEVYLQLDMSDSLGAAIDFDLFSARLRPTYSTVLKCYVWEDFRQAGWGKKMELKEALKHVTGIKFHFEYTGQDESVVDFSIKQIAFKNPYML